VTATTRRFLEELARRADLATTTGTGRAYRFAATATPTVVLALVQAVDAVQHLCDSTDALVPTQTLQQIIDDAFLTLAA
jgi:hypothetical protein